MMTAVLVLESHKNILTPASIPSLCKEIIDNMGGAIHICESAIGDYSINFFCMNFLICVTTPKGMCHNTKLQHQLPKKGEHFVVHNSYFLLSEELNTFVCLILLLIHWCCSK